MIREVYEEFESDEIFREFDECAKLWLLRMYEINREKRDGNGKRGWGAKLSRMQVGGRLPMPIKCFFVLFTHVRLEM